MWHLTPDSPEPDLSRRSWKSVGTSGIPGQGYRDLHGGAQHRNVCVDGRREIVFLVNETPSEHLQRC